MRTSIRQERAATTVADNLVASTVDRVGAEHHAGDIRNDEGLNEDGKTNFIHCQAVLAAVGQRLLGSSGLPAVLDRFNERVEADDDEKRLMLS